MRRSLYAQASQYSVPSGYTHLCRLRRCERAGRSISLGAGLESLKTCAISSSLSLLLVCSWRSELSAAVPGAMSAVCSMPSLSWSLALWTCKPQVNPSLLSCRGHGVLSQQLKSTKSGDGDGFEKCETSCRPGEA